MCKISLLCMEGREEVKNVEAEQRRALSTFVAQRGNKVGSYDNQRQGINIPSVDFFFFSSSLLHLLLLSFILLHLLSFVSISDFFPPSLSMNQNV